MKRDFDLVRKILVVLADTPNNDSIQTPQLIGLVPGYAPDLLIYNVDLMIKAGLIEGRVYSSTSRIVAISNLTWAGNDFLEAARSDSVWNQAKEKLLKVGGSANLEILKAVLEQITKTQLGLP
jgi:hypothetical protein